MTTQNSFRIVILLVILGLLGFTVWGIFDYGRYRAGFDRADYKQEMDILENRINVLEKNLAESRARTAFLESGKKVDAFATAAVKDTLTQMESEHQELTEELQFYRTIVKPNKSKQGLHIHDFTLTKNEKGDYNYDLTLIHIQGPKKHHRETDGEIRMSVEGFQDGVVKKLDFASINARKRAKIRYRFKYFAHYDGVLKLPDNFKPQLIDIKVIPRQKKTGGDSRQVKWPGADL